MLVKVSMAKMSLSLVTVTVTEHYLLLSGHHFLSPLNHYRKSLLLVFPFYTFRNRHKE